MDFEKRLERAIERGERVREVHGREQARKAMTEDDLRTLHSRYRLELSEHIERCLRKLSDHFPGFEMLTLVEDGWGAKITRDDLGTGGQGRQLAHFYSHFEMLVRPYTSTHIVELVAKGTIRNKEILKRTHYQMLEQADVESFKELIDLWVLEYAEKFAATR